MMEALLVLAVAPAMKLQHLRLSQGLEGSDLGPLDLGVKVEPNSNDFPTAFWIEMCMMCKQSGCTWPHVNKGRIMLVLLTEASSKP